MFRKIIGQSGRIGQNLKSVNLNRLTSLRSRSFNSNSNSQADCSRGGESFARRTFDVFLPRALANLVGFSAAWLAVYRLQNLLGVAKEERDVDEHSMLTKTYDRNITRDAVAEVRANARETREVKRAAREEKDWVTIIYYDTMHSLPTK